MSKTLICLVFGAIVVGVSLAVIVHEQEKDAVIAAPSITAERKAATTGNPFVAVEEPASRPVGGQSECNMPPEPVRSRLLNAGIDCTGKFVAK